jgi:hypothetical protein
MLYDSTKYLLQSILRSLETGDEAQWDDQTESGNACLYEMHQMSGRLYKAYRSDSLNAVFPSQSSLPERLKRAIPHARMMVIAIRQKDQERALASGHASLAELNGAGPSVPSACAPAPPAASSEAPAVLRRPPVRKTSPCVRASGGR